MRAERKEIVHGHLVEEYYWAGKTVVYIDNRLTDLSYSEAVRSYEDE